MKECERRESTEDGWGAGQEVRRIVRCSGCERVHAGASPRSVCVACASRCATMGSLEMSGSFLLNDEAIDETLTRTSPGNYALGYMDGDAFVVFYVGRSDCDVRQRLHEWVDMPSRYARYASPAKAPWGAQRRGAFPMGAPAFAPVENAESGYTHFAFSYARTADEAYAKEWRNYDDFGGGHGLDNESAPTAAGHPMNDPVTHAAAASAEPDGPHPRLMLLRRPPARCAP